MRGVLADLQHAVRVYLATPFSSTLAIVVLAVAMAFVSAFLSLWNDLSLGTHQGFEAGSGLVTIEQRGGTIPISTISHGLVQAIAAEVAAVEFVTGVEQSSQVLRWNDEQIPVSTEAVTLQFSTELRPRLALGRRFEARDHVVEAEPVTIISYDLWQERFQGRETVLGETVRVTGPGIVMVGPQGRRNWAELGQDYRIVGVMAPQMAGTFGVQTQMWMPYEQWRSFFTGSPDLSRGNLRVVGRLAGNANAAALAGELNSRYTDTDLGADLGGMREGSRLDAISGVVADVNTHREARRQVRLFLAGTVLLAVVAACNISLFLLARAARRQRELGIRMAVGASYKRLSRQLASEAGLLMLVATLLGVLVSLWLAVPLSELPFLRDARWRGLSVLDWRVSGTVAALTLVLTVFVSLAPIIGLRRLGVRASSALVTARAGWGQRLAGSAQLTVAGIVVAVALAFGWHLAYFTLGAKGFDADAYVVNLSQPAPGAGPAPFQNDPQARLVERERRREVIAGLPGVADVAFGSSVPGRLISFMMGMPRSAILDDPTAEGLARMLVVTTDHRYTDLLDLEFVNGRPLEAGELTGVLVNETLARSLWDRTDVAGETMVMLGGAQGRGDPATVAGVVRDLSYTHPDDEVQPMVFGMRFPAPEQILVSTEMSLGAFRELLQQQIDAGALDFEIAGVDRLGTLSGAVFAADRSRSLLTAVAAVLVAVLAAFGFYGTQRYLVTAGRREYAIRAALGAGPRALGRLVIIRGLSLGLPGLAVGALLAFSVVAWLRGEFVVPAVSALAVTTWVVCAVAALVLLASVGPARQARTTPPAPLLRED